MLNLRVTPKVGVAPLTVDVYASRQASSEDREWQVLLVEQGEEPIVVRRFSVSIDGERGQRLLHFKWTIPPGQYVVLTCVLPSQTCRSQKIEVR